MKQLLIPILALALLSACTPEPISQQELRNSNASSSENNSAISDSIPGDENHNQDQNQNQNQSLSDNKNAESTPTTESQSKTSANTFHYDPSTYNYHGEVTITGYPELTTRQTPFCTENCETYQYLLFKISNNSSSALKDYIQQLQGNAYVGEESIGLGCLTNAVLQYSNNSDELGSISQEFNTEETEKILNATLEHPITLRLTRYPLTQEMGATECYSHFAEIKISDQS